VSHLPVERSSSSTPGWILLLYYITDRTQFDGDEDARRRTLLAKIEEAVSCGVNLIQLRERDLPTRDLEALANQARGVVGHSSRLLINSRPDVAIACGADGVHLRSSDIAPQEVRKIWGQSGSGNRLAIGVSCHAADKIQAAASTGADFVVFAPVFEKANSRETTPTGLDGLREACRHNIPVLALGGITLENAHSCKDVGAAGIAGIRLFQNNNVADVVRRLRS